jgi:hypothetical protein
MFGCTGIVMPVQPNIYLILVDIWVNLGWSDRLRATPAWRLGRANFMALRSRVSTDHTNPICPNCPTGASGNRGSGGHKSAQQPLVGAGSHQRHKVGTQLFVGADGPDKIAIFAIRPGGADTGGYGGSLPRKKAVRAKGLEPPRCFHQQDLNLPRLPFRHARASPPARGGRMPTRVGRTRVESYSSRRSARFRGLF